jgi:hypothetical protein
MSDESRIALHRQVPAQSDLSLFIEACPETGEGTHHVRHIVKQPGHLVAQGLKDVYV